LFTSFTLLLLQDESVVESKEVVGGIDAAVGTY
jgi:hypothetical protein